MTSLMIAIVSRLVVCVVIFWILNSSLPNQIILLKQQHKYCIISKAKNTFKFSYSYWHNSMKKSKDNNTCFVVFTTFSIVGIPGPLQSFVVPEPCYSCLFLINLFWKVILIFVVWCLHIIWFFGGHFIMSFFHIFLKCCSLIKFFVTVFTT